MSLETRNLVIEEQFGEELAGRRIGWSAVLPYGDMHSDEVSAVHLATTTIGEDGATLRYEPREKDGETSRAYWSDTAEGFIATAGISIIIDKTRKPGEQLPGNFSFSFKDDLINGTSSGKILRVAGDGHYIEDELREQRLWAESNPAVMANIKKAMSDEGISDHYPMVYYTANILLGHERFRGDSGIRQIDAADVLLPDADMAPQTDEEIRLAEAVADNLSTVVTEDEAMPRNLTVFGAIPADQIPATFKESRTKVYEAEEQAKQASEALRVQAGVYLPTGFSFGGRTWPYMDGSLPPTDVDSCVNIGLDCLQQKDTKFVERELEREVNELAFREQFAREGVAALKLLRRLEGQL